MNKLLIIFIILILFLISCSIPYKPRSAVECVKPYGGSFCTELYDPVCGNDDKTYSNECKACTAGVNWYIKGECK